jgi:hypothetical protein
MATQRCVKRACVKQLFVLVRDVGRLPRGITEDEELRGAASQRFRNF